ncbi:MAG TPA: DUF1501 domain-containing protein [Armatimonadota bacterium]|nr:DUF1501 domain-containing protein [Armatimonadota bacterium]
MLSTRRGFLVGGALSLVGWAAGTKSALGSVSVQTGRRPPNGDVLVSIFLRGGADGLSLVVPYADDDYYSNRPTINLPRPRDARAHPQDRVVDLDGFFGLHPSLAGLHPLFEAGHLAFVHACGSGDQTRSHFEAMATVERGLYQETGPASGWLARHLQSAPWENRSPLRAVALGAMVPATLSGATSATALNTVADLRLQVPFTGREAAITHSLNDLYNARDRRNLLTEAGHEALSVLKTLNHIDTDHYKPSNGAVYPKDDLGNGMKQVALLIKSEVGLEAACLDHGSFDTHVAQGSLLPDKLKSLAGSLSAFAADLGAEQWRKTSIVVVSEFGRRVEENSGAGTDHGRGGVMMVLGGHAAGGRVHGHWPGLAPSQLEGPGDLHVTTDYRNVLAEVIQRRLGNPNISDVFPGLVQQRVGVTRDA